MQIDIEKNNKNPTAIDFFTLIAIFLILGIPVYGYFKLKPDRIFNMDSKSQEEETIGDIQEEIPKPEETNPEPNPIVITGYTEELVNIEGQWAYIAVPKPLDPNNPPTLVIYNHGSITKVEENLDPNFEKDLRKYAETFTPKNYIFAVSNARGFDLDSDDAISDNFNLYTYIKKTFDVQGKIYMTAYSKGGLATFNFTVVYPNLVNKIALIAPKMKLYEWDYQRAQGLKNIPIRIWHGTDDVNISLEENIAFITQMKDWGIDMELVTLERRDHWNVEIENLEDVLTFFNQSEIVSE